jgi:hypothetical protein
VFGIKFLIPGQDRSFASKVILSLRLPEMDRLYGYSPSLIPFLFEFVLFYLSYTFVAVYGYVGSDDNFGGIPDDPHNTWSPTSYLN